MNKPAALALMLALAAVIAAAGAGEDAVVAGQGTVIVELSGSFPLRPPSFLFSDGEQSLHGATMRLQRALKGPEPRLVLDLSQGFAPGLAAAEELAAVLRSRPAGKTVACLIDNADDATMVVAAACDEVVAPEAGMLLVDGLAMSTDYYADALAKLGIKFNAVTSGPAKSASETLTRSGPSETAAQEHEQLLQGLDRVVVGESLRPGLDEAQLRKARAQAPQPGALAKQLGLVHQAVEPGAWLAGQPAPVRTLEDDRAKADLSSFAGMMSFWTTLLQGENKVRQPQVVAVIELEGMILDGAGGVPGISITGTDTAALCDQLVADARVVAVVLRVNSGGGSAGASDRIHHAVKRLAAAKPVVALFDGVAASGGYYLACAAREILVHHGTITGSIGVFAVVPDLSGTRELAGIHRHTSTTGPRADLWSTNAMTPEKEVALRQVITDVDERFQGLVATNRKLAPAKVKELAGGRVYTGDQAVALGLADGFGTLASAVARARELAGVKQPLPLERYPVNQGLAAKLGLQATISAALPAFLPASLAQLVALVGGQGPRMLAWSGLGEIR